MTPRQPRLSILACTVLIASACGGATNRPEVPPQAAVVVEAPMPKPLPLEERVTQVLPLDSRTCGAMDSLLIDVTAAEVLVRCDRNMTRVLLTVVPRTTDPADHFRTLSLRFCGDVTGAEAPSGWKAQIERDSYRDAVAADVSWELSGTTLHQAPAGRLEGFAVSLRGDWRRGMGYSLGFSESGGPMGLSPHDCPYFDQ